MQRLTVEKQMNIGGEIVAVVVAAGLGWMANSRFKVGRGEFNDLANEVKIIKREMGNHVTRGEVTQGFTEMKSLVKEFANKQELLTKEFASKQELLVKEFRLETRDELKELKSELKTKT